jgi:hypothetical protein
VKIRWVPQIQKTHRLPESEKDLREITNPEDGECKSVIALNRWKIRNPDTQIPAFEGESRFAAPQMTNDTRLRSFRIPEHPNNLNAKDRGMGTWESDPSFLCPHSSVVPAWETRSLSLLHIPAPGIMMLCGEKLRPGLFT